MPQKWLGLKESLKACTLRSVLMVEAIIALVTADHLLLVRKGLGSLTQGLKACMPRIVPIWEAMVALLLADHLLVVAAPLTF